MGTSAFFALILAGLSLSPTPSVPVSTARSGMLAINCTKPDERIDAKGFVAVGEIDQWVTIRGDRCSNPAILFLHGGPGNPMSPFADKVYSGWEKDFTLVQWDQRGAGKTFAAVEALGAPPWTDPRSFGGLRRLTRRYEAKVATPAPDGWWTSSSDYASSQSSADYEAGEEYSYLAFVGEAGNGMLSTVDLARLGRRFQTPIFLVHGENDLVTVPAVALAYLDTIAAPQKSFTLVALAGHDPNLALVEAQYDVLRLKIRPLVQRASSRKRQ